MYKRVIALALLGAAFIAGSASAATTWQYTGVITACNPSICSLVPVFTGDPVIGEITIDVGVSDAFTLPAGFADFDFLVGGVVPVSPAEAILTGSGTTDALGDFASGLITGTFLPSTTLGGLGGAVDINLGSGGMTVTVGFGSVFVADIEGAFEQVIPIPASVWLFGSALGLLGWLKRDAC